MALRLRPFTVPASTVRPLSVGDVMRLPVLEGAHVIRGAAGLKRNLVRVNVMQVPTADFARSDDLVLATTTAFERASDRLEPLMSDLAQRGVAALAAHRHALSHLDSEALAVSERSEMPLIELPEQARLNTVLHAVLERLVAEQTTLLEEDRRVREHLAGFALAGSGVDQLPLAIGELTDGPVAVIDQEGEVLAASDERTREHARELAGAADGLDAPADAGDGWIVWPVRGASRRLGCIVAQLPEPAEPVHRAILEHGSTSAALVILQLHAEAAETRRLREQFIRDLLAGALEPDAVRERAELLGWDPERSYRVVLAFDESVEDGAVLGQARQQLDAFLAVDQPYGCLAIIGFPAMPAAELDEGVASLAKRLTATGSMRAGISATHAGMGELERAVEEAREMLTTARNFPHGPVRWFDAMNPLRMLSLVPRAELVAFADHALAPLDETERERRETLLETLDVLIATDLNVAATARLGGWHYNTVRYRIARLTDLIGPFMEDGDLLQSLTLALLIRRELAAGAEASPTAA